MRLLSLRSVCDHRPRDGGVRLANCRARARERHRAQRARAADVLLGRTRAITVWDSPEQRDRFLAERLGPAYEAVGLSLDEVTHTQFDVETLVAGDLTGMMPQLVGAED